MSVSKAKTTVNMSQPTQRSRKQKSATILLHPYRASMGQVLAGTGSLVFEGELVEFPRSWNTGGFKQ